MQEKWHACVNTCPWVRPPLYTKSLNTEYRLLLTTTPTLLYSHTIQFNPHNVKRFGELKYKRITYTNKHW